MMWILPDPHPDPDRHPFLKPGIDNDPDPDPDRHALDADADADPDLQQ